MKHNTMYRVLSLVLAVVLMMSMAACSSSSSAGGKKTFKVGICNYVDDASLNQIVENIENRLKQAGEELNVVFDVKVENCNADAVVLNQIIDNFIANKVDLMVGVATPVAMAMQAKTEDNHIPVIFSAVSDPLTAGLVDTLEKPGANISGTSDFLDTESVFNLIFAQNPDLDKVALLYDQGQDSSATPIADAKKILDAKNISYVEYTGTNTEEIGLAAAALIQSGIKVVFTPSDNTVMAAELSIYEDLAKAGVQHYAGADSFALNGAFLGYGVDYANLGVETADMVVDALVKNVKIAEMPVRTFDNGTATVNTEICAELGLDYDTVAALFAPFCTKVQSIKTAESFN